MIVDNRKQEAVSGPSETKEKPPPYSNPQRLFPVPPRRDASNSSFISNSSQVQAPKPGPVPSPSVNQMHLQTGPNPISGTFYIDPRIPSLGFDAKGHKARKKNPPHASFRTRRGDIKLELGTTGEMNDVSKASVLVASRTGDIMVKLLPAPPNRPRIGLEAFSRSGDVVLFLPRTFSGVVQLNTRKGSIRFLPAMNATMRVLKHTDEEALVLVGNQNMSKTGPNDNQTLDFCELTSRTGKVVVGLSDQDSYEPKVSLLKQLGSFFGMSS